jgi:hypothetical protein
MCKGSLLAVDGLTGSGVRGGNGNGRSLHQEFKGEGPDACLDVNGHLRIRSGRSPLVDAALFRLRLVLDSLV